jgi:hypothetical protein
MGSSWRLRPLAPVRLAALSLAALVCWGIATPPAAAAPSPLVGTFSISAGSCSGGTASGTYLRMVLSGGSNAAGPYFSNSDSSCSDNTYTPLSPGSARGLVTGTYQPEPSPAFDKQGNALAGQITAPVAFEGVKFATATNAVDPQTGQRVGVPTIVADGTALSGNLESFGVSWNNQQFNQGSPKPGGSSPGNTTPVTGNYDPTSGSYTLQWSSQVVGGPFNGFSAFWHLTGTFIPSGGTSAPPAASSSSPATTPPGSSATTHGAVGGTSPSTAAAAVPTPGATTTTSVTTPAAAAPSPPGARGRFVLTSHTMSTGSPGWNTPTWLVVLLGLAAALGLSGVVWSERALRQRGVSP